jgi:hypothetical protein
MINSDDAFLFHLYGTFQGSFTSNATIHLRVDCGSHCEDYGNPPGETPSKTWSFDFCEFSNIQQPLGGKKNTTCPPEKGWALIASPGYTWPMYINAPVSFSHCRFNILFACTLTDSS